jgi:hypothetical protein
MYACCVCCMVVVVLQCEFVCIESYCNAHRNHYGPSAKSSEFPLCFILLLVRVAMSKAAARALAHASRSIRKSEQKSEVTDNKKLILEISRELRRSPAKVLAAHRAVMSNLFLLGDADDFDSECKVMVRVDIDIITSMTLDLDSESVLESDLLKDLRSKDKNIMRTLFSYRTLTDGDTCIMTTKKVRFNQCIVLRASVWGLMFKQLHIENGSVDWRGSGLYQMLPVLHDKATPEELAAHRLTTVKFRNLEVVI